MRNKLIILTLLVSSIAIFLPEPVSAATANAVETPQIRVQMRRRNNQGRHRGWERGRHYGWYKGKRMYWYSNDPRDDRYIRRSYYDNGRRVTRWIWTY